MANEDLINRMIATYRDLNLLIRPIPEATLTGRGGGGESVRDLIMKLKDAELRFTQGTKELLTGQTIPDELAEDAPILGLEHESDPTRVVLSQFGTARESTLAMLREMTEEQWAATGSGGRTMTARVGLLLESDQHVLDRVQSLVGKAAAHV